MGRSWDALGTFLGRSWSLLAALGRSWDALGALLDALGHSWGALGPLLDRSWALLGRSWALLRRSWNDIRKSLCAHARACACAFMCVCACGGVRIHSAGCAHPNGRLEAFLKPRFYCFSIGFPTISYNFMFFQKIARETPKTVCAHGVHMHMRTETHGNAHQIKLNLTQL